MSIIAWLYYRKGRKDDLMEMTKYLEENHTGSYILMGSLRGFSAPELRPVSEAIPRLKKAISDLKDSTP